MMAQGLGECAPEGSGAVYPNGVYKEPLDNREGGPVENTLYAVLKEKQGEVVTIAPTVTVREAVDLYIRQRIGALPVVDEGKICGILSERDIVWRCVKNSLDPAVTTVGEVMTPDPICVSKEMTAEQAMVCMTQERVRHLPVVDGDRLIGIVSIGDLIKWVVRDQEHTIQDLMKYIYDVRA